jgi:hypothetical protein
MSTKWAAAWRRIAVEGAEHFGAPWLATGGGGNTVLTLTPVGWWLRQIGFNPKSYGGGPLFVRYVSLTVPDVAGIDYSQNDYYGDDRPRSDLMPDEPDAGFVLRWWMNGPGGAYLRDFDEQREISREETMFAEDRDFRPIGWPILAGWRLLLNSGPPGPVIRAQLARIDELGALGITERTAGWWREFLGVVTTQDRPGALRWLDEQRRATLTALKVPEEAIADGLSES